MHLLTFLKAMAIALFTVACVTYIRTGSLWSSLTSFLIASVILQILYFLSVLIIFAFDRRIHSKKRI